MSSWGTTTSDESKPKYLTDEEKRNCYATERGWTIPAGGNPDGEREVIAAIGGLSGGSTGTTRLAAGTISSVYFITSSVAAGNSEFEAEVSYNEAVTVTGVPTLGLTVEGSDVSLAYVAADSTANRLRFKGNITGASAGDEITIAANKLVKAGGSTIQDAGTTVDSGLAHGAGTVTITVAA